MGPSTNTSVVIFLAFTMNNGDTEDDFYDFNDFYDFHHPCCHFAVIIMSNTEYAC